MPIDYRTVLANDAARERFARWLRQQKEKDLARAVEQNPHSLSDVQRVQLERIIKKSGGDNFLSVLTRVGKDSSLDGVRFVPRYPNDTMQDFISRPPFNLTGGTVELGDGSSITVEAMNNWGQASRVGKKPFKAPRDVETALKAWRYLDGIAKEHGMRVDPWDVFAVSYPPIRTMLKYAEKSGGVIDVIQPWFMGEMPFANQAFPPFAQATIRNNLADTDHRGRGVITGTAYQHASEARRKPRMGTVWSYATGIARDAHEDLDFANLVFGYEMVLLMMPALRSTAPDGTPVGLVPSVDVDGKNLFSKYAPDVQTSYKLRVVPGDPGVASRVTGSRLGDLNLWPASSIASGEFDLKLSMLRDRLASFSMLPGLQVVSDDGSEVYPDALGSRIDELSSQHERYSARFKDRESRPLTREERLKRNAFYQDLNAFTQRLLRYTHVRGKIKTRAGDVSFEMVPRSKGIAIRNMVGTSVTVFGSDIAAEASAQGWDEKRIEALVSLRVIAAYMEGALGKKIEAGDRYKLSDSVRKLWPSHLENLLLQAADDYLRLESNARPRSRAEATLHRAAARGPKHELLPFYVHFEHLNLKWDELMARSYEQNGFSEAEYQVDRDIVHAYFSRIRHPHFIFDRAVLNRSIADTYQSVAARGEADKRILKYFSEYGINTDPEPRHPLSAKGLEAEGLLVAWAYDDYLNSFAAQYNMDVRIPVVQDLVDEVVDRQLAEHRGSGARRSQVQRGLLGLLKKHNEGKKSMKQRLERYPLPSANFFERRFNSFVEEWRKKHDDKLPADVDMLRAMVRSSDPKKISGAKIFIDEWKVYQDRSLYRLDRLMNDAKSGIVAFVRNNYDAAMYTDGDFAGMAANVVRGRFEGKASRDLMSEAGQVLGDRFNPYPEVRGEAETFLTVAVTHYFNQLTHNHINAYTSLANVFDEYGDMITNAESADVFVGELAGLLDGDVRTSIPSDGAGKWLAAHERTAALLAQFMGLPFTGGLAERVAHVVEEKRKASESLRQNELEKVQREFDAGIAGLQGITIRLNALRESVPASEDVSVFDTWLEDAETALDEFGMALKPLHDLAAQYGGSLSRMHEKLDPLDAVEVEMLKLYEQVESARDNLRARLEAVKQNQLKDVRDRLKQQVPIFSAMLGDVERLYSTFEEIKSCYGSTTDYEAAYDAVMDGWSELFDLRVTINQTADTFKEIIDEASSFDELSSEAGKAGALFSRFLSMNAMKALEDARVRLLEAESSFKIPKDMIGFPPRTPVFYNDSLIMGWWRTGFKTQVTVSREEYEDAVQRILSFVDKAMLVSDGVRAYFVDMTDDDFRLFEEWRKGDRSEPLMTPPKAKAHTKIAFAKRPDDVPNHPIHHLMQNFRALADSMSPEMYFVSSLMKTADEGNKKASELYGQIVAYLTERYRRTDDIRFMVRRIAVSTHPDIMNEAGFADWLVKEPAAMRVPLSRSSLNDIAKFDYKWIAEHVYPQLVGSLDERFVERQHAILVGTIKKVLIDDGDEAMAEKWTRFVEGNAEAVKPMTAVFAVYRYSADVMDKQEASIVSDDFLKGLHEALGSIDPDALARYSLIHYEEHRRYLFYRALEDAPAYIPEFHSMDQPWVKEKLLSHFKGEHPSVRKLLERTMSSPSYLHGGALLRLVSDEKHPLHGLMPTVMRIFREYAGYNMMSDGTIFATRFDNTMEHFVDDLDQAYRTVRDTEGHYIPEWWSVEPDELLGAVLRSPETAAVRWRMMHEFIGCHDGKYDPSSLLSKNEFNFINRIPQVAGAVVLYAAARKANAIQQREKMDGILNHIYRAELSAPLSPSLQQKIKSDFITIYATECGPNIRSWLAGKQGDGMTYYQTATRLNPPGRIRWTPRWTWVK